jgi:hypothetical protein
MDYKEITSGKSLQMQISQLKADRKAHEEGLSKSFNELTQLIFHPVHTAEEERFEKQNRKRDLMELSKTVLNMGTDYIIEQSFGRRQKFQSFLTSIMVEIVSTPFVSRNITKLFLGIDRHLSEESESTDLKQ